MRDDDLPAPHARRRGGAPQIPDGADCRARLQQAGEHLALIVRGSAAGIWEWDLATGRIFLSPQFKQLLGWPEDKFPDFGDKFLALVHPRDVAQVAADIAVAVKGRKDEFEMEFRIRGIHGAYHWFHCKAALMRDAAGRVTRGAGSMTEITPMAGSDADAGRHRSRLQKTVEAQIQHIKNSEARLTTAINAISDGFCLFDHTQAIVMVNDHMRVLHPELALVIQPGASAIEIGVELIQLAKSKAEQLAWAECFERLSNGVRDDEIQRADGTWLKISRAQTPSGDTIVLHSDVTRYKQQEARLVAQTEALEQALRKEREMNDLHRQFVFMASHEFRTPLAIIDGSAQLISADPTNMNPQRVAKRIQKIRAAVNRMTSLIDSTLTATGLDAGKFEINCQPCDLRSLVRDVCDSFQDIAAGHDIICDLSELPAQISADRDAIERVFTNLISNAVKYSPANTKISLRGWQSEDKAIVAVTDNGVGISDADIPRLFSRFFRAETSVGTAGTGLGLCVAQDLVKLHGGFISVASQVGKGSTFTVTLPIPATRQESGSAA